MESIKIIIALKALSIYQQNAFMKFVNSEYFNNNEALKTLCHNYLDYIKSDSVHLLTKELVWSWISKEKYNDKRLRYANSELLKLFEKFTFYEKLETNNLHTEVQKFIHLVEYDNDKLYRSKQSKLTNILDDYPTKDSSFFLEKFLFEKTVYQLNVNNRKDNAKFLANLNIVNSSQALDNFYAIEKLKLYSNLLTWKRIYNIDTTIDFTELVIRFSKSNASNSAYTDVIIAIIDMQLHSDHKYFHIYRDVLINSLSHIKTGDLREFFEAGFNYCIAQNNKGDSSFQKEALNLYKIALEKRAILHDDTLSTAAFNNIVFFALKESQYDWAESFILEYAEYLDEQVRESTKSYCLARLAFFKEDFRSAIHHLAHVEFNSVVTTINSKVMQLFSYYELEEDDALDSLINSFRVYLNREKSISKNRKTSYKNLLHYTKKISRINPNDIQKINKLKTALESDDNVVSKAWLLNKLEALKQKR